MIKLKELELQEITLEEIISFSKLKFSPIVTITDELTASQFNYIVAYADLLKLFYVIVKDTRKIAFLGNAYIALKIGKNMGVKTQVMHLHTFNNKKPTETNVVTKHSTERYIVKAFDQNGDKTQPFIDTNVENVNCEILSKLDYRDLKYNVVPRKSNHGKIDPKQIQKLRKQYLKKEI